MKTAEEVLAESRRLNEEFARDNGREDIELTEGALRAAIRKSRRVHVMIHGKKSVASLALSKKAALEGVSDIIGAGLEVVFYSKTGGLWILA